jgi:hypothetical protein
MNHESVTTRIPRDLAFLAQSSAFAPTVRQETIRCHKAQLVPPPAKPGYEPKVVLEPEAFLEPDPPTQRTPARLTLARPRTWTQRVPLPVFFTIGLLLGIVIALSTGYRRPQAKDAGGTQRSSE